MNRERVVAMINTLILYLCLLCNIFVVPEDEDVCSRQLRLNNKYSGNSRVISNFSEYSRRKSNELIVIDKISFSDSAVELLGAKNRSRILKKLPKLEELKTCTSISRYNEWLGEAIVQPVESVEMWVEEGDTTVYSTKSWEVCCIQADGSIRCLSIFVRLTELYSEREFPRPADMANVQPSKTTLENRSITETILKPLSQTQIEVGEKPISPLRKFIVNNKNLIEHERRILKVIGHQVIDRTPQQQEGHQDDKTNED